jgi:hypothetical protein
MLSGAAGFRGAVFLASGADKRKDSGEVHGINQYTELCRSYSGECGSARGPLPIILALGTQKVVCACTLAPLPCEGSNPQREGRCAVEPRERDSQ